MDFETVTVGKRVGGRRRSSRRLGGTVAETVPEFVTAPAATNGFVGEDGFRQTDPVFSRRGAKDECCHNPSCVDLDCCLYDAVLSYSCLADAGIFDSR